MQIPGYRDSLILERATPNNVNLGLIGAAGAEAKAASQVLDVGTQIAQRMKEANDLTAVNEVIIRKQKEDLDFQTQFRKQNESNPMGMAKRAEEEYKKRNELYMQELPSEEARTTFQQTTAKLDLRNYENDINYETKRTVEMFKNKADISQKNMELMAYQHGIKPTDLKGDIDATIYGMKDVLAPDEMEKYKYQMNAGVAEAYVRGAIERNPYEGKKVAEQYAPSLGYEKFATLTDKADAGIKHIEAQVETLRVKRQRQILEDPAQLAVDLGANSPQEIIDKQRELGIREGNISVIPKQQAEKLVNDFSGMTSSDQFISRVETLKQKVGEDNFDTAMSDLAKAKLPQQVKLLALMNPTQDKRLMDASFAMAKDGDIITKKATAQKDITVAKIEESVSDRIIPTLDILASENPNGEAETAGMLKSMSSMATYFVSKGYSIDEASDMATTWLNKKLVVGEVNNKKFRVPPITTPNKIEPALEEAISTTDFSKIKFEDDFNRRTVRPVLHSDEQRYYLLNDIGLPVEDDKGVIYLDIQDILKQREVGLKKVQDKAAIDSFDIGN
jgi:hypothetical protein